MHTDSESYAFAEDTYVEIEEFDATSMLSASGWSGDFRGELPRAFFTRENEAQTSSATATYEDGPLVVGVHGSWHTDEFWSDTIAGAGVEMVSVNLSTDQKGTSFDTDSDEVVEIVEDNDEVLLVGHSRGGTVCLWAADKLLKRGIDCSVVLVNSAIDKEQIGRSWVEENQPPRNGYLYDESFIRKIDDGICEIVSSGDLKDVDTTYLRELANARALHPDSDYYPEVQSILRSWGALSHAEKVIELFYHDCTFETQLSALHSLRPHRRNDDAFTEPVLGYVPKVPIYSIVGTHDKVIRPNYSRYIAERWLGAQAILEIPGGHSLPIARRPIQEQFFQALRDIASGKYRNQAVLTAQHAIHDTSDNK
jgi:pimeloyl-ACP methyl ester carboxylesterase